MKAAFPLLALALAAGTPEQREDATAKPAPAGASARAARPITSATSSPTPPPTPPSTSWSAPVSPSHARDPAAHLPSPLPAPSNVRVWEPSCDPDTRTLSFKVTWDPALLQGRPWARYLVAGTQCAAPRSVTCCEARVTGCSPGTHLGAVQADYGELQSFARSASVSSKGSADGAVFVSGACGPGGNAAPVGYRPRS